MNTQNSGTLRILTEARELVVKGFYKGYWCQDDCYCAAGAINKAATGTPYVSLSSKPYIAKRDGDARERALFFLTNAIEGREDVSPMSIYVFNDKVSKEDVLKAFDRAIANCKRRHISTTPIKTKAA